MRLNRDEDAILDGQEGPARQKAMELLVRYGEALGAERLVDTNNVCGGISNDAFIRKYAAEVGDFDAVFSEFNLDSQESLAIPQVKAFTCHLITGMDPEHWRIQGVDAEAYAFDRRRESFCTRIGIHNMNTCAPYLVGNVPVKGEHCAWMESSAVVYCNSVLGARTNTEGTESVGAAMLVGKIPYWGYHLDENRLGTHRVAVEIDVDGATDWGLLGYYVGEAVQERIPVFDGIRRTPDMARLKHCGAAAASSGGVEMYHIVGVTPEARSMEEAFGDNKPSGDLGYGEAERRDAYDKLNSASDPNVDFVVLGCPHYSIDQLWEACRLLEGKRVHSNVDLWIFAPRAIRDLADRQGYTRIVADAGGVLMTDTCPAIGRVCPEGARVVATDSAKQAHYLPPIMGLETWFGSQEDCIRAAISGKWRGELR
ncbi:MAG: DUF521 domain-containing protein [Desulfobacterales bacterium]|nr:DUF521 domain-containing protein [Desulfobacterales bacterium]